MCPRAFWTSPSRSLDTDLDGCLDGCLDGSLDGAPDSCLDCYLDGNLDCGLDGCLDGKLKVSGQARFEEGVVRTCQVVTSGGANADSGSRGQHA
jgi:hypothetical protein